MAIHDELVSILANYSNPVRAEMAAMLAEPSRRLVRVMKTRTSQLQQFEGEYEDLVEFARKRAIPHYGRF